MKPAIDVGMVIHDFAPMRAFYVEAIGLRYLGAVGAGTATVHFLGVGESLLKLYEDAGAVPRTAPSDQVMGLAYVTLDVPDLDALLDTLARAGHAPIAPVFDFDAGVTLPPPAGRVAVRVAMFEDPEGNRVELIERR